MRLPANGSSRFSIVDAPHEPQIDIADGLGVVVHRPAADAHQFGLALHRQCVRAVDHFLALSSPALASASSKKSFSSVSCQILACSALRSTGGSLGAVAPLNTSPARSSNCRRSPAVQCSG